MEQVRNGRIIQKIHLLSWMLSLEKDGYILCVFKNCRFMALDVDEMALHYKHCIPDNGAVLVECNCCEHGTDKLEKLLYHQVNSHSYEATGDELSVINDFVNVLRRKGDSSILERAWQSFLENKNYLKCFIGNCHYVTSSMSDMKQHYLHDCTLKKSSSLKFTCHYCDGRTGTAKDLEFHIETCHSSTSSATNKYSTKGVNDEIIKEWSQEIQSYKQARCLVPHCRFVDNSIRVLSHHLIHCNGTMKSYLLCSICNHWLLNESKLTEHELCIHNRVRRINEEHTLFWEIERDYLDASCNVKETIASAEEIGKLIIEEVDLTHNHEDPCVKKYGGATKSKVFPERIHHTDLPLAESTQAIDYEKPEDNSRIQYAEDFVEQNTCSLDIVNVSASHLGCMLYPEETYIFKKPYNVKMSRVPEKDINIPLPPKVEPAKQLPTSLEMLGDEMMKENKNSSSVSVSIEMDDKDWTVSVPENIISGSQLSDKFPKNSYELMKSIKQESSRLLQLIARKTTVRNYFDLKRPKERSSIIPFRIESRPDDEDSESYSEEEDEEDRPPCGPNYSSVTDEISDLKEKHHDSIKTEISERPHLPKNILFERENSDHSNFENCDESLIENSEAMDSVNNDLSVSSENIMEDELTEKQSSENALDDSFFGFSDEESTVQKYNSFVSVLNKLTFKLPYASPKIGLRNIELKKRNSRYTSHNIQLYNNTEENVIRSDQVDKRTTKNSRNGVCEREKTDVSKRKYRSKSLPGEVYKKNSRKIQTRKSTVVNSEPLKIGSNGTLEKEIYLKNVQLSVKENVLHKLNKSSKSGDKVEDKLCESTVSFTKNETIDHSVKRALSSDNSTKFPVNILTAGIGLEVSEQLLQNTVGSSGIDPSKKLTAIEKLNNSISFLSEGAVDSDDSREPLDEHFDPLEDSSEKIVENTFQNKIGNTFSSISNILVHSEIANEKRCSLVTNGKISGSIIMDTSANMNSSDLLANTSVVISLDGTYEGESSSETTEAISNSPIKLENTVDKDGISVTLRNVLENIGDSEGSSSLDPTDNSVGSEVSEKANKNDPKVNKTIGRKSKTRLEGNNKDGSTCSGEPLAEVAVIDSVLESCSEITHNPNNGIQQKRGKKPKGRPEEEINDEEASLRNPKKRDTSKKFKESSLATKQTLKRQNKSFSKTGRDSSPNVSKNDAVSKRSCRKSKTRSEQIIEEEETCYSEPTTLFDGTDSVDLESDLETMPLLLRAQKLRTKKKNEQEAANDTEVIPKRGARKSGTRIELIRDAEIAANDSDTEVIPKRRARKSRTRMEDIKDAEIAAIDSDTEVIPRRGARKSRTRLELKDEEIAANDSDNEAMPKRKARKSRTRMEEIKDEETNYSSNPISEIAANESDTEIMPKRGARKSRTRIEEMAASDSDTEVMPKRRDRKSRTRMEEIKDEERTYSSEPISGIAANDSDTEVMPKRRARKSRTRMQEIKDEETNNSSEPISETNVNDPDIEVMSKRSGRKSRTRMEEIKDDSTCSSELIMEIAANDSVDLESDSEVVSKRRGRKSRTRLEEIKDEESTISEPADSVDTDNISKSRGRKRKAVLIKDEETSGNFSGFLGFEIESADSICVDESLDSSNLEPPVPKKRGRKPRVKTEESDSSLLETMFKEKYDKIKGDFSDSKTDPVRSEEFASDNALASSEVTVNNHSLDAKMADSSVNQSLDSSVPEIRVPKKRGRKPKVKTVESDVASSKDPDDSLYNTPNETSLNSLDSAKTVQLSSRGRSRKVAVYFDYDLEFSDDDILNKRLSSTPKKKRRRKLKSNNSISETSINSDMSPNLDESMDKTGELPGSASKKIRRKRNILAENGDSVEDNINSDVSGIIREPKRRGRKPYKKSNDIEWDPTAYIASGLTPVLQRTIKKKKRKNLIPDYRKELQNKSNSSANLDLEDKTESQNSDISSRMSESVPKLRIPSDSELCTTRPQLFALMKNQTLSGRIDTASKFTNENAKVKCGVCGEIMAVKDYKNTHLLKHNFLSWLEGEEPMDLSDKDAMMLIMARGKRVYKNFVFKCELCGEVKKSALGYFCHTVSCGKSASEIEDMMVNCPYCKRLMMPTSIDAHMYYSHRIEPEEKKEDPVAPSATRKAATMCLNKILGLTTSNGDYEYNYNPNDTMEETAQYTKRRKRKLSKHITSLWRKQLSEGKAGSCSMPGCIFTSLSLEELSHHFRNCGDVVVRYKCNSCGFVCFNEDEIKVHTQSCSSYTKSEPDSSLYRGDSDTSDEENNDYTCFPFLRKAELSMARRGKQLLGCGYGVRFFKPALQWMDSQYETCFSQDEIFSNYGTYTDMIQEMEPEECKDFTILLKSKSMRISFQDSDWEEMETFRSKKIGGKNGLAYTGGAVWGLGWCPGEGEQFLAVSTRTGRETDVDISCTSTGPSMLQIWSLGNINNAPDTGLERLTFEYGICDDNGGAWGLAWCPGPGTRTYTRLGLVVLATFSGSLPIYSIPHPSVLPTSAEGTRLYKTEPVLRLEISSNEQWQCTCISWSELKPHNIIAAGFANGLVAVWDLSVDSKLLRRGNILYPFKTFSAHNTVVTGISLSPMNEHSLVSTSFDGTYKYWDLRETGAPVSSLRKGITTNVAWMRHWLAAATSFDNAYVLSQTSLNMNSLRSYMYSSAPYVGYLDATAWSLSVNDWLNCLAAAYEDGQVLLCFALKQLLNSHDDKKRYLKGMLQCNLHDFDEEESIEEKLSLDEPKGRKYINSNSYVDSVGKYGLKIKADVTLDSIRMPVTKNTTTFVDTYPLNSANRVSWNPNKQSFLYLATGLQAGFIIVSKLHLNKQESSLVEKLSDPSEDRQESILIDQLSDSTANRQESLPIDKSPELIENQQEVSIDELPELIENRQESLPIDELPVSTENQEELIPIDESCSSKENGKEST